MHSTSQWDIVALPTFFLDIIPFNDNEISSIQNDFLINYPFEKNIKLLKKYSFSESKCKTPFVEKLGHQSIEDGNVSRTLLVYSILIESNIRKKNENRLLLKSYFVKRASSFVKLNEPLLALLDVDNALAIDPQYELGLVLKEDIQVSHCPELQSVQDIPLHCIKYLFQQGYDQTSIFESLIYNSSEHIKLLGNLMFKSKNYQLAHKYFSIALGIEKECKRKKSILLTNRATASYELKDYLHSLNDASEAVCTDCTYSKAWFKRHLAMKALISTSFEIATMLGQRLDLEDCNTICERDLAIARSLYENCEDAIHQASTVAATMNELLENFSLQNALENSEFQRNIQADICPKMEKQNESKNPDEMIEKELDLLIEDNSPESGRLLRALTKILKGQLIHQEFSAAQFLLLKKRWEYCSYCMTKTSCLFSCSYCTNELYCSRSCCRFAWNSWHKLECSNAQLKYIAPVSRLALRLSHMLNHHQLKQIMLLNLHCKDIPQTTFATFCAQTIYFHSLIPETSLSLILALQCICLTNVHTITVMEESSSKYGVNSFFHEKIGLGLFPRAALINHSCRPNAMVRFKGNKIRILATATIQSNEEVFISYGPHSGKQSYSDRQSSLRTEYFFDCKCIACVTHKEFEKDTTNLSDILCPCGGRYKVLSQEHVLDKDLSILEGSCSARCNCCDGKIESSFIQENLHEASILAHQAYTLLESEVEESVRCGIECMKKCLVLQKQHIYGQSKLIGRTHDQIAQGYAQIGDYVHAAQHCEESIRILMTFYSNDDIELGYEYYKMAQLCFNAIQVGNCSHWIDKALHTLGVVLDHDHEILQELQKMKSLLNN